MAGYLDVSDDLFWSPAGWVYDRVLEDLASAVDAENSELANTLLDGRTSVNGGFLDLRPSSRAEVTLLARACNEVWAKYEQRGPTSDYYPMFMDGLRSLREMLATRLSTEQAP